jgi:hypothetical protein
MTEEPTTLTVDGRVYRSEDIPEQALNIIARTRATDAQIQHYRGTLIALGDAYNAQINALREALEGIEYEEVKEEVAPS